jgi:hypothetical protein
MFITPYTRRKKKSEAKGTQLVLKNPIVSLDGGVSLAGGPLYRIPQIFESAVNHCDTDLPNSTHFRLTIQVAILCSHVGADSRSLARFPQLTAEPVFTGADGLIGTDRPVFVQM